MPTYEYVCVKCGEQFVRIMSLKEYEAGQVACPKCDRVCQEMAMIWASGPLLGTQQDMDQVADAIFKVYENRDKLASI